MIIGTDESGKGDYFGYIVVAGVASDSSSIKSIKVKDSKKMVDSAVHNVADEIRKKLPYSIVKISPEKYNTLYVKMGNMNHILAWAHAKVIENLLEECKAEKVVVDKFASKAVLDKYLMKKGKTVKLEMRVRGEEEPSVAAASILARSVYLGTLRSLGREVGMVLPKGATHVIPAARQIVKMHGKDVLPRVAKMNFKTTKNI